MLERKTLECLFRQHYGKMLRLAMTLLRDDAEAEDIVQELFARLMQAGMLPAEEKREAYLMTCVHHACLNAIRHKAVWQRVMDLYPIGDEAEPFSYDETVRRLDDIRHCADALDEPHRTIFHLHFDEGLTIGETARRLHLNASTCYKYLRQGIDRIRRHVTF